MSVNDPSKRKRFELPSAAYAYRFLAGFCFLIALFFAAVGVVAVLPSGEGFQADAANAWDTAIVAWSIALFAGVGGGSLVGLASRLLRRERYLAQRAAERAEEDARWIERHRKNPS